VKELEYVSSEMTMLLLQTSHTMDRLSVRVNNPLTQPQASTLGGDLVFFLALLQAAPLAGLLEADPDDFNFIPSAAPISLVATVASRSGLSIDRRISLAAI
jgi:hypothetical protein